MGDRAARSSADDLATDPPATRAPFHEIAQIVAEYTGIDAVGGTLDRAYRRALTLSTSGSPRVLSERVARIAFAAEVVAAVAPALACEPGRLRAMIDRLVASARISRCLVGRDTLRAPTLFRLPPNVAMDVALSLLLAFTGARAAALWAGGPADDLPVLASAGEVGAMPEESQRIAQQTIADETVVARHDGALVATKIAYAGSAAALVVFGDDVLSPQRRLLLDAVEPLLTLALAHQPTPATGCQVASCPTGSRPGPSADQDALVAATKRLTRLRFDLHDGPQQDVLMLAEDLWQFRDRLQDALTDHPARDRLLVGIDDLEARLIALDGDLRRLSASVESPFLQPAALPEALTRIAEAFATRTGIEPTLEMSGDLTNLTDSQQITLLALVREALSNVREHANARHVSVIVSALEDGLTASVVDDGRGFEPETALIKAAHGGHLGLVSMHERVRMLGGRTEITSRPGGPTAISLTLPPSAAVIG